MKTIIPLALGIFTGILIWGIIPHDNRKAIDAAKRAECLAMLRGEKQLPNKTAEQCIWHVSLNEIAYWKKARGL